MISYETIRVSLPYLKVYSYELFLFQLTNDFVEVLQNLQFFLFLSKAVFIKRTLLFQYFVLK